MWDRPSMRWGAIPAIFFLVGPPAGAVALLVMGALLRFGLAAPFAGLPIMLVASYPLGGGQALLTGLAAAATLRPGGPVRAWPTLLASVVVGVLLAAAVAAKGVGDDEGERARFTDALAMLANGATLLAVYCAGALAGVGACRWIERRHAGPHAAG